MRRPTGPIASNSRMALVRNTGWTMGAVGRRFDSWRFPNSDRRPPKEVTEDPVGPRPIDVPGTKSQFEDSRIRGPEVSSRSAPRREPSLAFLPDRHPIGKSDKQRTSRLHSMSLSVAPERTVRGSPNGFTRRPPANPEDPGPRRSGANPGPGRRGSRGSHGSRPDVPARPNRYPGTGGIPASDRKRRTSGARTRCAGARSP